LLFPLDGDFNHFINDKHKDVMRQIINKEEMKEMAQDARRALGRERERMMEEVQRVDELLGLLDTTDELLVEVDRLNDELAGKDAELDNLHQQLQEEKERNQALEMKLSELSKLSAGVAKKSSQDELLKALRTFVNKSKHKRIDKRIAVKEMVLEMAMANSVTFPEDLAATIDSLDDEQPEAKVVNVAGNYNDIHDNGHVSRA
jgi:DNA repair exonuclease SbcCD ATPase subunit